MIFVTVGTHEQPFNRLVMHMDRWASEHNEDVVIQTGFSTYEPQYSRWQKLFPYKDMLELVRQARIVITHGGPSSFIMPLQIGKIPVVVPRKKEYNEHVNDHQVSFCRNVAERQGNIIVIEDVENLERTLERYDEIIRSLKNEIKSNNTNFCANLNRIVSELMEK